MLRNYFLVGIRNIKRQSLYSFINIIGLAVGLCCVSLILLYVQDELSYDKHHSDFDKIYRLDFAGKINDSEFITCLMSAPAVPVLQEEFPQYFEESMRLRFTGNRFIRAENSDQNFKEEIVLYADSNLFTFWDIPLVYGNPKEALNKPNTLALNRRTAEKIFGDINPVGKTVILSNKTPWTVGAVFENIPDNSHFEADIILTMLSRDEAWRNMWLSFNFHSYFKIRQGVDVAQLEKDMNSYIPEKYLGPEISKFMNMDLETFKNEGNYFGFSFMPLGDIHLKSNKLGELRANGDIRYIYIFSAVGIFILLLASVNFINLATARSISRAKEVGLRKVLGAKRGNLITQFLSEAFLITLFASLLSYFVMFLIQPLFNEIANKSFTIEDLTNPEFILLMLGITVVVALVSGIYPSFYLSRYQPVKTLKGKILNDKGGMGLRNGLVVFQFAVSLVMIVGTVTVNSQLKFIQNKKLGYDKERLLLVEDAWIMREQINSFKNELLKSPTVKNVSIASFFPVDLNNNNNVYWPGNSAKPEKNHIVSNHYVDHNFLPTLNLEILNGRNFSKEFSSDSMSVIINETCVRQMGLEDPLGKYVSTYTEIDNETSTASYKIIGVVKDFHFKSLREVIQPVVLHLGQSTSYACLKLESNADISDAISMVKSNWDRFAPGQPFAYSFLDDRFNRLHKSENQISRIINIFTLVAIIVACLGLFGLSSFTANQKTKEIGIRKVLGASSLEIVKMLSFKFLKPVLIALIFAFPIAWYAMQTWLEDFAYRIELNWSVFVISAFAALILAWLTMSYHSIKAANTNPAQTLKDE